MNSEQSNSIQHRQSSLVSQPRACSMIVEMNCALTCKICSSIELEEIGLKRGQDLPRDFQVCRCKHCGYAFVSNPSLDYEDLYSEKYYRGQGADPLIDYVFELENPNKTIRQYEWRGILRSVRSLIEVSAQTRWLDFGCGNGGLTRYVRENSECSPLGYEQGWIKPLAEQAGIQFLSDSEMEAAQGTFDVVTAIEVLEHVADPIAELRRIRSMLKPGGLFFYTTGNARPHRKKLLSWSYLVPEIHISLYEPKSLSIALSKSGFRTEEGSFRPGFSDIIRYKVLKSLRIREPATWEVILPWPVLSRLVDSHFRVTGHPTAWAI